MQENTNEKQAQVSKRNSCFPLFRNVSVVLRSYTTATNTNSQKTNSR